MGRTKDFVPTGTAHIRRKYVSVEVGNSVATGVAPSEIFQL